MNLKELADLIQIRQYVVDTMGNPTFDRATIKMMGGILLLLDKKIVNILGGAEFKEYIGYGDVQGAILDAARITNIKSGIKK